jgi:glutathione synthase/RimK-type ligase-like ATP-grasp enzyme
MSARVLLCAHAEDLTAKGILAAVQQRGVPASMMDVGDFPSCIQLDARIASSQTCWQGWIQTTQGRLDIEQIRSVLFRRTQHYRVDETLPPQLQAFCEDEAAKGFGGILRSLPCLWVSPLDAIYSAQYKPRQLCLAAQLGLHIPRTLITNDAEALTHFYQECSGHLIYKTLHSGNVSVDEQHYDALFTHSVQPEHLQQANRVHYTAHLFQEQIQKAYELRITIIDERVFTGAIYSQHSERTRVDFRACYDDLKYAPFDLPEHIAAQCKALLKALGLVYGAIDMIVTPQQEFVFLEVNPIGQYGWIEYYCKLPITESIADLLVEGRATT